MLVNEFLTNTVNLYPHKEALVCNKGRYSYREIEKKVNRFVNSLLYNGLKKRERVIIWLENSLESVISIFGVLQAGGVFVVINPQVKPSKMAYIMNDCGAKALITDQKHFTDFRPIVKQCEDINRIYITDLYKGRQISQDGSKIGI